MDSQKCQGYDLAMLVWQYTNLSPESVGGVEKHIAELSEAMRKLGHQVHVGLQHPALPSRERMLLLTHPGSIPGPEVLEELRSGGGFRWIAVCHGTSVGRALACREYFSLSAWKGSWRDYRNVAEAPAVACVSTPVKTEVTRYFRVSSKPTRVISGGANPEIFKPLLALSAEPDFLYLGRAKDRVKNLPRLLGAFDSLVRDFPEARLKAVPGLDETRPYLENLGEIPRRELGGAFRNARALVLCSLYESDSLVLHEAQATGIPIVASDLPALRENLSNYANKIFVDPRSEKSIEEGLRKALQSNWKPSPHLRSWEQVAKEFLKFFDEL